MHGAPVRFRTGPRNSEAKKAKLWVSDSEEDSEGKLIRRKTRKGEEKEEQSLGPDAEVSLAPLSAEWRGTSMI